MFGCVESGQKLRLVVEFYRVGLCCRGGAIDGDTREREVDTRVGLDSEWIG